MASGLLMGGWTELFTELKVLVASRTLGALGGCGCDTNGTRCGCDMNRTRMGACLGASTLDYSVSVAGVGGGGYWW